jgi:hypothetical protein
MMKALIGRLTRHLPHLVIIDVTLDIHRLDLARSLDIWR